MENLSQNTGENALSESQEQNPWEKIAQEVTFAGGEKIENEPKFIKLEELEKFCPLDNCILYGHGTGSSGNGHEVVDSIFSEGLKGFEPLGSMIGENRGQEISGSTDLSNNAIGLYASGEEAFDSSKLKDKLDNWPHRGAENIILMRLPQEYFHIYTNNPAERTEAFYTVHEDENGHKNHYLDRRLIFGNYNKNTGMVELNEHFEPEISDKFKKELDTRLKLVQEKTEKRNRAIEENGVGFYFGNVESVESKDAEPENDDWSGENEDWG